MNRILLTSTLSALALSGAMVFAQAPATQSRSCSGIKTILDCPEAGCGQRFDPELNKRKNIRADGGQTVLRTIEWMKQLKNPKKFTAKNRDRAELESLGEGQKITVVAWALAARKGGAESCNCKLTKAADTDNHIVLVGPDLQRPTLIRNEKRDSETAEFTPRVRLDHPNFTQQNLQPLIDPDWEAPGPPKKGKLLVRVTGILMFDSEHFLAHPLKRHNNWEIHPVLKMEYCAEGETCDPESDENWADIEGD